jgi:hypothetical protein
LSPICNKHYLVNGNTVSKTRVQRDVHTHLADCILGRLKGNYTPTVANQAGEWQRVRSYIRSDVEDRIPRLHESAVKPHGAQFESTEQIDRQIDSFRKVEIPGQAMPPGNGAAWKPEQSPEAQDQTTGRVCKCHFLRAL